MSSDVEQDRPRPRPPSGAGTHGARQRARVARRRRGRPRVRLGAPELRQGALPRPLRPRPGPPAPARDARGRGARRGVPGQAARGLRRHRRRAGSSARRRSPTRYLARLADIGAFGMKIPREYGGLGLTMSSYGKALMLVGSAHPSLGALLSAHQSIGVPEPVKLVGTAEQKQAFLPRCAAGAISAFLLTEPDVGSDPARMGSTADPHRGRHGIPPRRGEAVDHQRRRRRAARRDGPGARARRPSKGGITAFVVEGTAEGITVERRNSFMGLKGIENGAHPVPPGAGARREPARQGGRRAQDRAHHPQRRSALHPGDVRRSAASGR